MITTQTTSTAWGHQVLMTIKDGCGHNNYVFGSCVVEMFKPVSHDLRRLLNKHCPPDHVLDVLQLKGCYMQVSFVRNRS